MHSCPARLDVRQWFSNWVPWNGFLGSITVKTSKNMPRNVQYDNYNIFTGYIDSSLPFFRNITINHKNLNFGHWRTFFVGWDYLRPLGIVKDCEQFSGTKGLITLGIRCIEGQIQDFSKVVGGP